jgi:hypothetical protein
MRFFTLFDKAEAEDNDDMALTFVGTRKYMSIERLKGERYKVPQPDTQFLLLVLIFFIRQTQIFGALVLSSLKSFTGLILSER